MQMQRKKAEADELWSTEHITMLACVFSYLLLQFQLSPLYVRQLNTKNGSENQQSGRKNDDTARKKKKKKTTNKERARDMLILMVAKRSSIIERYEQELKSKNKDSTKVEFDYSIPSSYPF